MIEFEKMGAMSAANIHVMGYGEEIRAIIDLVKALDADQVVADVATMPDELIATEDDLIAIVLAPGDCAEIKSRLNAICREGILTLLVTTQEPKLEDGVCDSCAIVPLDQFCVVVKTLLDIVLRRGLINIDFNDLKYALSHSGHFSVYEEVVNSEDELEEASRLIYEKSCSGKTGGTLIIALSVGECCNPDASILLKIAPLTDNVGEEFGIDVLWTLLTDETLPDGAIKLSVVVAGAE